MPGHSAAAALLLLLVVRSSRTVVPPPADVKVSCQNVTVTASWEYSQHQPQTSFTVTIKGSEKVIGVVNTSAHHCDLSKYIWESEHYLDFLFITVAAIQGGNQSETADSNSFSFNDLKTVETKCLLDFPPVDVDVGESGATVSFQNPIRVYPALERTVKSGSASFIRFTVSQVTNGSKYSGHFEEACQSQQDICKTMVPLMDGEKCFMLKGVLSIVQNFLVRFRDTAQICALDSAEKNVPILAAVLVPVFLIIVTLLGLFICKARAWTTKTPDLPKVLRAEHRERVLRYDPEPSEEEGNEVLIVRSLSVISQDGDPPQSHANAGSAHPQRLSESSRQALLAEENRSDSDSADYSEKTGSDIVESEEDELVHASAYEGRPAVRVDMGDGDFATGYTGN